MDLNGKNNFKTTQRHKVSQTLWQSHIAAFKGFWVALQQERNLKIHVAIAGIVLLFAWIIQVALWEWVVLLLLIGLVISAELMNTAIEHVVDLVVGDEWVALAGRTKDIAAAAVVVLVIISVIIGSLIFGRHLVHF